MRFGIAAAALAVAVLHAPAARPCGAVASPGTYVRLKAEQAIVVWDASTKTEHFVRKPTFEGDPKDFGFFVPTPAAPRVAKVDPKIFTAFEALVPYRPLAKGAALTGGGAGGVAPGAVKVEQTVQLDDFELVTLRAGDARALVDWLGAHGFASRPSLEMWARRYVARGWVLNAMRYAPKDPPAGARAITTPTMRLSFAIDVPFYPYTEAPPDPRDEEAFFSRAKAAAEPRPLDLWVVSDGDVEAREGAAVVGADDTPGPERIAAVTVPAFRVEEALGSPSSWGFASRARETWTVTRFREDAIRRTAFDDLTFEPPGSGMDDDEPAPHRPRGVVYAVVLGCLALAFAIVLTDRSRQGR